MKKKWIYLLSSLFVFAIGLYFTYSLLDQKANTQEMTENNISNKENESNNKNNNNQQLNNEVDNELMNENEIESQENIGDFEIREIEPFAQTPDSDSAITVDTINEDRITPSTKLVMQYYYSNEDRLIEEEMIPPYYLLDLTRDQMARYVEDYVANPTDQDLDKEIADYKLISFSSTKVVLRKVYNGEFDGYYQVYIDPNRNKIIVENPDGSIREDIDTPVGALPEAERLALQKPGRKVYTEVELLQLIESYSS